MTEFVRARRTEGRAAPARRGCWNASVGAIHESPDDRFQHRPEGSPQEADRRAPRHDHRWGQGCLTLASETTRAAGAPA